MHLEFSDRRLGEDVCVCVCVWGGVIEYQDEKAALTKGGERCVCVRMCGGWGVEGNRKIEGKQSTYL